MLMGLHPRLESEMVQELYERPVAFPLAMLAVTAVFAIVLTLVAYGVSALSAPAPTEMVQHTADVPIDCIRHVSHQ